MGGVPVEYMAENKKKAWVRFRYPRWMYHGATICGVPVGVSPGCQRGPGVVKGLDGEGSRLLFDCWYELWLGTIRAHRQMMLLEKRQEGEGAIKSLIQ